MYVNDVLGLFTDPLLSQTYLDPRSYIHLGIGQNIDVLTFFLYETQYVHSKWVTISQFTDIIKK